MSKIISAGSSPRIIIEAIDGDLSVVGWDGADILIKGDDEDVRVEQSGDEVTLSCQGELSLRVPKAASFQFNKIAGDASIRGVMGNLEVKEIHGDVSIRDVEGNISIDSVADDLALRGARGNVKVNVGEDVVVYLEPKPDGTYSVTAGDDILLVLPPDTNATLNLHGDRIDVDWPGIENEEDDIERGITLGDGSAKILLHAGGDIRVTSDVNAGNSADEFGNFAGLNFDWSGFGDMISRQVERATGQAARRAGEAARRAERLAADAARRAERHAERHARRWKTNVNVGRWNWDFNSENLRTPPSPPPEPVAEEERLAILKMLADKKITAEQAEQLLNALEGGQ